MRFCLAVFLLLATLSAQSAEIKGKVTNALGGEALGRVEVIVLETKISAVTSLSGEFDLPNFAPGSYTLRLNAVGYRMLTIPLTLVASTEVKEFSITLVPDNFHHTDKVEVHADIFQSADSPATNQMTLTASEIREASTVFADDPFRAVQALPGVSASANNEFFAEFSVMGAPFSSVSIYMDDVLVPQPFHEIENFTEGASLGVLTSEVVEEMKLMPAAYPEKFGDAVGAALDVHTREGSRGTPLFRVSAGIAASDFLVEGGFGHSRKGSWLVSGRKSYINYLVQNRVDSYEDIGYEDADVKLNYDLTPRQSVSFLAISGPTTFQSNDVAALKTSLEAAFLYAAGKSSFSLARAGWRWGPTEHLLLEARGAYIREADDLSNPFGELVTKDLYHEWMGGGTITWAWGKDRILQAGWTRRLLEQNHLFAIYDQNLQPASLTTLEGSGARQSEYIQQTASALHGKVHVLGSVRWDSLQQIGPQPFSPQLSVAIQAASATQLQFAAGRYAQFPDFLNVVEDECGQLGPLPETSTHFSAAVEQRLGELTRVRLEVFDRQDALSLGYVPGWTPTPGVFGPCRPWEKLPGPGTYQRDYSRGAQIVLQRRSANRLSGWLGYTLVDARQRRYAVYVPGLYALYPNGLPPGFVSVNSPFYPTLADQRNSFNAFAMYRLKPTVNLSGKFLYGSGFPVPSGTYLQVGNTYQLLGLNTVSLGTYARLDLRVDKDWAFQHWKLTLYGELLNVTNHDNRRYYTAGAINPATGQTEVNTLQGLPITPTAGIVFQF
jgi:CarboxypepD_reg-like domain